MSGAGSPQIERTIVLVGMMGTGKSSVGRKLAKRLDVPFVDADQEIEKAAGCPISDIFEIDGEKIFRDGERRVIARLLKGPPHVLATGGGAFMDPRTRANISRHGTSVWLRAAPEALVRRLRRRTDRPLLRTEDPAATLRALLAEREPVYAKADITVASDQGTAEDTVNRILSALGAARRSKAS